MQFHQQESAPVFGDPADLNAEWGCSGHGEGFHGRRALHRPIGWVFSAGDAVGRRGRFSATRLLIVTSSPLWLGRRCYLVTGCSACILLTDFETFSLDLRSTYV